MAKNPTDKNPLDEWVKYNLINEMNEILYQVRLNKIPLDSMRELSQALKKYIKIKSL
jgi:hypothetical protein